MKNKIILVLSLCLCMNLVAQRSTTLYWYIADSKMACTYNNTITACLQVRSSPDSVWKNFPHKIEGFIFEPGTESYIELLEKEILYPEANGPKFTYTLVKVLGSRNTVLNDKRLLANNKWKLINIEIDRKIVPARKANGFMVFDLDSNRISGFGGCNSFGGNTKIENGDLTFGAINITMLSCVNDEVEKYVREALVGKAAYYVRNNILFIVCQNRTMLHFRPEKRLDSIIAVIEAPPIKVFPNTYTFLKDGNCFVRLDDVPEVNKMPLMFRTAILTATEKKTMKHKLLTITPDSPVSEIQILKKLHKIPGMSYVVVTLRDGTKKTVEMKNVL